MTFPAAADRLETRSFFERGSGFFSKGEAAQEADAVGEKERRSMRFDDFCEFVQVIVLDEMPRMYEASASEEWPAVEEVLRARLDLKNAFRRRTRKTREYLEELDASELELYEILRDVRRDISMKEQIPAYAVFTNRTLAQMCLKLPFTMQELQTVYGVGEKNSVRFGQAFLDAIHEFAGRESSSKAEESEALCPE